MGMESWHLLNYGADHSLTTTRAQTRHIQTMLSASSFSNSETGGFPQNGAFRPKVPEYVCDFLT
jgi:hypothetical protein